MSNNVVSMLAKVVVNMRVSPEYVNICKPMWTVLLKEQIIVIGIQIFRVLDPEKKSSIFDMPLNVSWALVVFKICSSKL